jgi:predicted dehydrogenase
VSVKREKLKFAVIGAGRVAKSYQEVLLNHSRAEIVAVVDDHLPAARAMGERIGCRSFQNLATMVKDSPVDAAIVCTPPASHAEISIALLKAGAHVLCEKPFSINVPDARRMVHAAWRNGLYLTMASKFRFVADVILAKNMVSSGILGDLLQFENVFASRVDMSNRWQSVPEISGGGVLIDNGTHSVDLMRYFLGSLDQVHVLESRRSQGLAVEDTVAMFVRSKAGAIGSIDLSWSIDKQRSSFLDIYGSRGAISIGWKGSRHLEYKAGNWVSIGKGYDKAQAFRSQIDNFCGAIRGENPLLLTADEAVDSVAIMEAAYRSLRQSQWVEVLFPEPIKGVKSVAGVPVL